MADPFEAAGAHQRWLCGSHFYTAMVVCTMHQPHGPLGATSWVPSGHGHVLHAFHR